MRRVLPLLLFPLTFVGQMTAQQEAPGSVEGRVTNAQTGDVIAGVSLHLYPLVVRDGGRDRRRQSLAASSQTDGNFHFENVPPGTYFISAERDGFVAAAANTVPQRISVSAGQQVTDIAIQMNPQAILRGKITDENGNPASGAKVQVFTTYSARGKAQLVQRASTTTNNAGEYKLKDLAPGIYYLAAQPAGDSKKGATQEPAKPEPAHEAVGGNTQSAPADAESFSLELVRTFYPKAPDFESATPLEIAAGQDLADINVSLRRIVTYQVRGKIEASIAANSGRNWTLLLGPRDSLPSEAAGTIVHPNPDGTFEIPKVAPGSYTLTLTGVDGSSSAHGRSSGTKLLARQDIDVVAADVNGIVLSVIPPITLIGRVLLEGSETANLSQIHLNLTPTGGAEIAGAQGVPANADGTFTVDGLEPGEYVVHVAGNPAGTYVKSISFNRQDITAGALNLLQGGSGEIDIVLRSGTGELDGTVVTGQADQPPSPATRGQTPGTAGTTVILVPDTLAPDASGMFFGSAPVGGNFAIKNVTPGHYYAFALERWSSVWQNPDFLHEIENGGTSVDIPENAHIQVQLPLTTTEQVQQVVARLGLTAQ